MNRLQFRPQEPSVIHVTLLTEDLWVLAHIPVDVNINYHSNGEIVYFPTKQLIPIPATPEPIRWVYLERPECCWQPETPDYYDVTDASVRFPMAPTRVESMKTDWSLSFGSRPLLTIAPP